MMGGSLTLSLSRSLGVDFLMPIGRSYNAIFINNNLSSQTTFNFLLLPLTPLAWAGVTFVAVVLTTLLLLLKWLNLAKEKVNQDMDKEDQRMR